MLTAPSYHSAPLPYRYSITRSSLVAWLKAHQASTYHSKSLLGHVYALHQDEVAAPALAAMVGAELAKQFWAALPAISSSIKQAQVCADDLSVKLVIALADGCVIETMILPEKTRITVCVSSQVGCAQGCAFCATARMKLVRQLATHEIIEQVVLAAQWITATPPWQRKVQQLMRTKSAGLARSPRLAFAQVTNVVFMGMGEPCDNHEAVIVAAKILIDPWCLKLSPRRVTLSTAGHLHGLRRIFQAIPQISYAISIHSPSAGQRSLLMPINRRFALHDLIRFLQECSAKYGKTFFIQYVLIAQVNDSLADAHHLAARLQGVSCKVNLLAYNPISARAWQAAPPAQLEAFAQVLRAHGYRVSMRFSKAQDIHGACGQLVQQPPAGVAVG